jgi:hypothetical protein
MSLKQFLKPDWRKIIVAFIIFMIICFIIIFLFSFQLQTIPKYKICCDLIESTPYISLEILNEELSNYGCEEIGLTSIEECKSYKKALSYQEFQIFLIFTVANLLYSYILSCLIIWIYDKVKK